MNLEQINNIFSDIPNIKSIELSVKMDSVKSESMEINEMSDDPKNSKTENKLAFSIDNLLADKFVDNNRDRGINENASTSDCDYFSVFDKEHVNIESDDDKDSSDSEQLDVESSTADAQEFAGSKPSEYSSGNEKNYIIFYERL